MHDGRLRMFAPPRVIVPHNGDGRKNTKFLAETAWVHEQERMERRKDRSTIEVEGCMAARNSTITVKTGTEAIKRSPNVGGKSAGDSLGGESPLKKRCGL